MSMRVLVTGATGFVGRFLCKELADAGYLVRAAVRRETSIAPGVTEQTVVGDIGSATDWSTALRDVNVIIHAAARAHVLGDDPANSDLYFESNARGTARLAQQAAAAGVHRLIFLSSVKVNGERSGARCFRADDVPDPQDAYGKSKAMAEQQLWEIARVGIEIACVRLPLVYGPGVRANFLRLLSWVERGYPLPLASVDNQRSLVSLWNLCSLLVQMVDHPAAAGRTWMVSDGEDTSTPELIRRIGAAMQRPVRLLPMPPALLQAGAWCLGRNAEVARLCGSLCVDISSTRQVLAWTPPLSVNESLARTVRWYLRERSSHAD